MENVIKKRNSNDSSTDETSSYIPNVTVDTSTSSTSTSTIRNLKINGSHQDEDDDDDDVRHGHHGKRNNTRTMRTKVSSRYHHLYNNNNKNNNNKNPPSSSSSSSSSASSRHSVTQVSQLIIILLVLSMFSILSTKWTLSPILKSDASTESYFNEQANRASIIPAIENAEDKKKSNNNRTTATTTTTTTTTATITTNSSFPNIVHTKSNNDDDGDDNNTVTTRNEKTAQKDSTTSNSTAATTGSTITTPSFIYFNNTTSSSNIHDDNNVSLAIFYNVFIAPTNIENGLRIVKEQMAARAASPIIANVPLYYTHIGAIENVTIEPLCQPSCTKLRAVESGGEVLTLQSLYEYCQVHPVSGRVIYIHDKGSYTYTKKNEKLRRVLTEGAFSEECTNMPRYVPSPNTKNGTNDDDDDDDVRNNCDVCSAQFSVFPFHATVGNMFLAECEYVTKLIPPNQFTQAKEDLMAMVWNSTWQELGFGKEPDPTKRWHIERRSWVGTGRYAMEHWIYSHPSIRPCDVFHTQYSYDRPPSLNTTLTPRRRTAPDLQSQTWADFQNIHFFHPWFKLPGRLYEYKALYNEVPANSSFVYEFYNFNGTVNGTKVISRKEKKKRKKRRHRQPPQQQPPTPPAEKKEN